MPLRLPAALALATALCVLDAAAQHDFRLTCPAPDTIACLEELPEPDLDGLVVQTDCGLDVDGNPVDTTAGGGGTPSCDTVMAGCYLVYPVRTTTLDEGSTRYEVEIAYGEEDGCRHAVSHVAFGVPDGIRATDLTDGGTYVGQLGTYDVENTTNNPFHAVKFESRGDGFEPGATEVFAFTLPPGASLDGDSLRIRLKAGRVLDEVVVAVNCSGDGGVDSSSVRRWVVRWDYDYVVPGGTGCADDPLVILRSYSATDGCLNSAFCDQQIVVAAACGDSAAVACDSSGIWRHEGGGARAALPTTTVYDASAGGYAVAFAGVDEGEYDGLYELYHVGARGGIGGGALGARSGSTEPVLIGLLRPDGSDAYTFAHASIGSQDSVSAVWRGEEEAVRDVSDARPSGPVLERLRVSPNPGSDRLGIDLPRGSSAIVVRDLRGAVVLRRTLTAGSGRLEFDAATWRPGVYVVTAFGPQGATAQARWAKVGR